MNDLRRLRCESAHRRPRGVAAAAIYHSVPFCVGRRAGRSVERRTTRREAPLIAATWNDRKSGRWRAETRPQAACPGEAGRAAPSWRPRRSGRPARGAVLGCQRGAGRFCERKGVVDAALLGYIRPLRRRAARASRWSWASWPPTPPCCCRLTTSSAAISTSSTTCNHPTVADRGDARHARGARPPPPLRDDRHGAPGGNLAGAARRLRRCDRRRAPPLPRAGRGAARPALAARGRGGGDRQAAYRCAAPPSSRRAPAPSPKTTPAAPKARPRGRGRCTTSATSSCSTSSLPPEVRSVQLHLGVATVQRLLVVRGVRPHALGVGAPPPQHEGRPDRRRRTLVVG